MRKRLHLEFFACPVDRSLQIRCIREFATCCYYPAEVIHSLPTAVRFCCIVASQLNHSEATAVWDKHTCHNAEIPDCLKS